MSTCNRLDLQTLGSQPIMPPRSLELESKHASSNQGGKIGILFPQRTDCITKLLMSHGQCPGRIFGAESVRS